MVVRNAGRFHHRSQEQDGLAVAVNFDVPAVDRVTVVCSPPPGSLFEVGTHEVRCPRSDNPDARCSLMVTVTLPGGSEIVGPTSFTVVEGETAVGTLMATDADTPAADLVWSTAGDADSGQFALDESGALRFAAPKDYEAPEDAGRDGTYELTELTAQASDGTDETAAAIREHLDDLGDVYLAEQRLVDLRLGKISRRPARRRDGARWRRRSSLTRPPYATWTSSTSSRGGGFSFFCATRGHAGQPAQHRRVPPRLHAARVLEVPGRRLPRHCRHQGPRVVCARREDWKPTRGVPINRSCSRNATRGSSALAHARDVCKTRGHTEVLAGRRPRPPVANERLRYTLKGLEIARRQRTGNGSRQSSTGSGKPCYVFSMMATS